MSAGFPAVYRNDKGEQRIVPNMLSSPVGFYRDPDAELDVDGFIVAAALPEVDPEPKPAAEARDPAEGILEEMQRQADAQKLPDEPNPLASFFAGTDQE